MGVGAVASDRRSVDAPEAPRIPASERGTAKPDIRSGPDAWKSDPTPIPADEYDGDAGGPHSLDEVIFD